MRRRNGMHGRKCDGYGEIPLIYMQNIATGNCLYDRFRLPWPAAAQIMKRKFWRVGVQSQGKGIEQNGSFMGAEQ